MPRNFGGGAGLLRGGVAQLSTCGLLAGTARAWGYLVVVRGTRDEAPASMAEPEAPSLREVRGRTLRLRRVGRLLPLAASPSELEAPPDVGLLRPVRSGDAYRIASPPARGRVTPQLAEALEAVFERFAREHGFTRDKPLEVRLARGFQAGSQGHGEGRAADIVAVSGKSLLAWKQEWDKEMAACEKLTDGPQREAAIASERRRNLGYGLYAALQEFGGWRVNPQGWRVYRHIMQLFGPWTATQGPWRAMQIEDPSAYQRQRLADQRWVFQAHQDHLHVAR